jgi:parallel beta-helix repeat protein
LKYQRARIQSSSPTIEKNIITNNQACVGAGIAISFGSPIVQGNTITKNVQGGCSGGIGGGGISIGGDSSAQILDNVISENFMGSANGGGISLFAAGTPTIKGNTIRGNTATGLSPCAEGGGISLVNVSDAVIVQNLIAGNSAGCGGGIFWLVPSGARGPLLVNNTIADNDSPQGSSIFADGFDAQTELLNNVVVAKGGQAAVFCGDFNDLNPPIFKFNNIFSPSGTAYDGICTDQTGINGNISVDSLFVEPANGNYHVQLGSPVIDTGDNAAPELPDKDIDGDQRITDGDGDSVAVVDMGVDEFTTSISAIPFATFDTRLLLFINQPVKDRFSAKGSFTLGDASNGIDPLTEKLVFSLVDTDGTFFEQTLPPGSFHRIEHRSFLFRAVRGSSGIHLMIIRPTNSAGGYAFEIIGKKLDLSAADNPPVTVSLRIGDDAGSETISCKNLSQVLICR